MTSKESCFNKFDKFESAPECVVHSSKGQPVQWLPDERIYTHCDNDESYAVKYSTDDEQEEVYDKRDSTYQGYNSETADDFELRAIIMPFFEGNRIHTCNIKNWRLQLYKSWCLQVL